MEAATPGRNPRGLDKVTASRASTIAEAFQAIPRHPALPLVNRQLLIKSRQILILTDRMHKRRHPIRQFLMPTTQGPRRIESGSVGQPERDGVGPRVVPREVQRLHGSRRQSRPQGRSMLAARPVHDHTANAQPSSTPSPGPTRRTTTRISTKKP